jgi:hypothetical protein
MAGCEQAEAMQAELTGEISLVDPANAQEVADALRLLLSKRGNEQEAFVVEVGGARAHLQQERLVSLPKLVDGVATTIPRAESGVDEIAADGSAEVLGVAPVSVVRLNERGHLRARAINGAYRLGRAEVLSHTARQSAVRREAVSELAKLTQQNGL